MQVVEEIPPEAAAAAADAADAMSQDEDEMGTDSKKNKGSHLRVVNPVAGVVSYLPMMGKKSPIRAAFSSRRAEPAVALTGLSSGNLLTVQPDGLVNLWQVREDDIVK